jgi:hypothetical protein
MSLNYLITEGVIVVFGELYLRCPTMQDVECLLKIGESQDFLTCSEALTACTGNGKDVLFD